MFRQSTSCRQIAAFLRGGGLIAYPTESCYGLGCDPNNRKAVQRLLKLKQRPQHKGLILLAANYQQLARYLQPLTVAEQQRLLEAGASVITCLMPARAGCPRWLTGQHATLAVRLSAHPYAKRLSLGVDSALVSTSANRSGQRSAKTYAQCKQLFGSQVWVLPGYTGKRKQPSTIQAWTDGKIVRK